MKKFISKSRVLFSVLSVLMLVGAILAPVSMASTAMAQTPSPTANATQLGRIEVLGEWSGSELDSFNAMIAPWQQQTGGNVDFTGTRDFIAVLSTRVQANNPPDVAILPNPGLMQQYARAGNLKPLSFLDMDALNQEYSEAWIDLGSANSTSGNLTLYAIFMKATNKGIIWYNPKTFANNNWQIPETWDQLISLSDNIVAQKKVPAAPWAMGVESAQSSGWPGTDWIAEIFLSKYGGAVYDQWVNHQIPWTDARIKDAWNLWGQIVNTPGYVPGGAAAVAATNFQDASFWPFQSPPQAAMYYEGDFVENFLKAQFPSQEPGTDYDFFPFVSMNSTAVSSNLTAITGGANLVVVFKDNPTVRSFVQYLASASAQEIWVKRGGYTALNKQVPLDAYPDAVARKSAEMLTTAELFRFGAGDMMPSAVQTAWWQGILTYLQNPSQLDSILQNIESVAATAYR